VPLTGRSRRGPGPHELAIDERTDSDGRRVLVLAGDIDLTTMPHLTERVLASAGEREVVVLDLAEVRFMDSPGLGSIIHCHRRLAESGATLVLRAPGRHLRDLFELVQLDALVTVEPPV
jgi:anti-sigma B factor antagonist